MPRHIPRRLSYHDGQVLSRDDFRDEQLYHREQHRRHLLEQHTPGIVTGLEVVYDVENRTFYVLPGQAVDPQGQALVLALRHEVPPAVFHEHRSDDLEVWLVHGEEAVADAAGPGQGSCGVPGQRPAATRIVERPRVQLRRPGVPSSSAGSSRSNVAPVPTREDGVFLAMLRHRPEREVSEEVDLRGRRYAGIRAGEIRAPWDASTRVELGSPHGEGFAVFLGSAASADGEESQDDAGADADPSPVFEVNPRGDATLRGSATVTGPLQVAGGAVELRPRALERDSPPAQETTATPWQVSLSELANGGHELRVEIPGEGEGRNRVSIGAWSPDAGAFVPILSVADDRTVTVKGNLVVEGLLLRHRKADEAKVSPEAQSLLLSGFLSGIAGVTSQAQGGGGELGTADATPTSMDTFIDALRQQPGGLESFVRRLKSGFPDVAESLKGLFTGD